MDIVLNIQIDKEGNWFVIHDLKYGVATQGKTIQDAICNFHDAFESCFADSDWRQIHHISSEDNIKPVIHFEQITANLGRSPYQSFLQALSL